MSQQFAGRILVFANGAPVYRTHPEDAARLVRDGLAVRRCSGRKVRALDLVTLDVDCSRRASARGNPQKYTYMEPLGDPVSAHCHSLKPHVANKRNWPIFRAALIDCLPPAAQAEIRQLFAKPNQEAGA